MPESHVISSHHDVGSRDRMDSPCHKRRVHELRCHPSQVDIVDGSDIRHPPPPGMVLKPVGI